LIDSRKAHGKKHAADTVIRNIVTPCRSPQASLKKAAEQNRNNQALRRPSRAVDADEPIFVATMQRGSGAENFQQVQSKGIRRSRDCDAVGHRLPKIV